MFWIMGCRTLTLFQQRWILILKLIQRYTAHNLTVWAVMGIYWRHYHVKNKKYGNLVSISSLTGKCTAQKLKKLLQFYSMDMFTANGHINKPK